MNKLNICIYGSYSHYPDWLLLKGAIRRFSKNKKITENCVFYICGYIKNDSKWDEIVNLFKRKKNLKVEIREGLDANNYMNLLKDMDVCLMPLEYTEFNICKSALKLMECAIANVLPVGSALYSSKELKGIVVAETPLQYEQTIEKLLDRDYYNQVLNYVTAANLKDADVDKRIENTKAVLVAVATEDLSPKLKDVLIKTIVYDENQMSEYETYNNSHIRTKEQKSYLFEYNPIIDIVDSVDTRNVEYLGIFSWKFPQKTGFSKNILLKTLNHYNYKQYDFLNVSKSYWKNTRDYLEFSYKNHPNLKELLEKLLNHLGKNIVPNKECYMYSNFFVMKTEHWKDYVENWIKPAIEFMDNNSEYSEDAKYISGLPSDKLKELTGLDYYSYHTFILERLIVYFVADKKLKFKQII